MLGGRGNDRLIGRGDDFIDERDHSADRIDCGDGEDTVVVDAAEDGVFDCENVQFPLSGTRPKLGAAT